jgi:hypothetical protein
MTSCSSVDIYRVSEKITASVFRVEHRSTQLSRLYPEDGSGMFLRNFGTDTASHFYIHCSANLGSHKPSCQLPNIYSTHNILFPWQPKSPQLRARLLYGARARCTPVAVFVNTRRALAGVFAVNTSACGVATRPYAAERESPKPADGHETQRPGR